MGSRWVRKAFQGTAGRVTSQRFRSRFNASRSSGAVPRSRDSSGAALLFHSVLRGGGALASCAA